MKKICFYPGIIKNKYYASKTFRIMRLTVFLILISVSQVFGGKSYSQITELSLNLKNVTVQQVLDEIEEQSEFYFLYSSKLIDVTRKVDVDVENRKIDEILDQVFTGTGVNYAVMDRQILLSSLEINPPASQLIVNGKVTGTDGVGLPGVNISIKGTSTGTITDIEGNYTIQVDNAEIILVFSYVGYLTQEIRVGTQQTIDVQLVVDITGLDEIVVIGYGTQKKVNLTGAVSDVDFVDLANKPGSNLLQSLQGEVAGIFVTSPGGQPGVDRGNIRIRGIGTFDNPDPLVIIDGITVDLTDLSALNPNDVKSISVLKDAASAAIYGSRAANGVILVTTKEGKKGTTSIRYDGYFGSQQATILPNLLNAEDYAMLANEARINSGNAPYFSSDQIALMMNDDPYDGFDNVDWVDKTFNTAPISSHTLSFNGGTERLSTQLSVGYLSQDGIMIGSGSERYTFRGRIDFDINNWFSVGMNVTGYLTDTKNLAEGVGGQDNSIMRRLARTPPSAPVKYENGNYFVEFEDVPGYSTILSPLRLASRGYMNNEANRLISSIYGDFNILEGLKLKTQLSYNFRNIDVERWVDHEVIENDDGIVLADNGFNRLTNTQVDNEQYQFEAFLTYTKLLAENHDFNMIVGYSFYHDEGQSIQAYGEALPNNEIHVLDAATANYGVSGSAFESALNSVFGRINYSFRSKYLVEGNIRYDGSSRFNKENRWGLFPSVSFGWRISEESFMSSLEFIDNLKLRGSWGRLGNQNINNYYPYTPTYDVGQNYLFGNVGNPTLTSGVAVTTIANDEITWETTESIDFGIDATFFKGLDFSFDYFVKTTTDVLLQLPIPATLGDVNAPFQNAGEIQNKGWESIVNYRNHVGQLFFTVGFNLSNVENKIIDLKGQEFYPTNRIHTEGEPFGAWYGYNTIGIFQSQEEIDDAPFQHAQTAPGDIQYADLSGPDGTPDNVINSYDRTVIGNNFPEYVYGFNAGLDFKGFDLKIFFQGVKNVDVYSSQTGEHTGNSSYVNWTKEWLNRWTAENPSADYPRLRNNWDQNELVSDFWLHDGSYLRLKNLELGYTLPKPITNRVGIDMVRIYIGGQNLLTWTKVKNYDPERIDSEIRNEFYPQLKIYQVGINCQF